MKLEGKKIAFGMSDVFYAFKDTIAEIRNVKKKRWRSYSNYARRYL
ncbi:MAG: hypothetical protein HFJ24_05850 [Clostridia bacterium]|nr:hypothetical protein [Clostridia bacterium]MCI9275476.1 hypothetical protein [Clostridia bacterium]